MAYGQIQFARTLRTCWSFESCNSPSINTVMIAGWVDTGQGSVRPLAWCGGGRGAVGCLVAVRACGARGGRAGAAGRGAAEGAEGSSCTNAPGCCTACGRGEEPGRAGAFARPSSHSWQPPPAHPPTGGGTPDWFGVSR